MTKDDIIRMARQACDTDKVDAWHNDFWTLTQEELERFFHMAQAAEREACAKECQEQADLSEQAFEKATRRWDQEAYRHAAVGARFCLSRIRARGQA
jgi:hypothetical protein